MTALTQEDAARILMANWDDLDTTDRLRRMGCLSDTEFPTGFDAPTRATVNRLAAQVSASHLGAQKHEVFVLPSGGTGIAIPRGSGEVALMTLNDGRSCVKVTDGVTETPTYFEDGHDACALDFAIKALGE